MLSLDCILSYNSNSPLPWTTSSPSKIFFPKENSLNVKFLRNEMAIKGKTEEDLKQTTNLRTILVLNGLNSMSLRFSFYGILCKSNTILIQR